jgi:prephenate dehydrogenase
MRVAILGFGLIGGSIARALAARAGGDWSVAAWSPRGEGPRAAAADGMVDLAAPDPAKAVAGSDLVILAAPPLACLEMLDRLAGPLRDSLPSEAIVTDVASTKRRIVERAAALGLPFVGGHPMAGRETTGYEAADAALFTERPWVICAEGAPAERVNVVERLARATGARPVRMSAEAHDAAVAEISHLPLLVSAALVEAVSGIRSGEPDPDWPAARALAASGWRDMTRLARGDPAMGAGIAATNEDLLADRVRALRAALGGWLEELERRGGPDPASLEARFAAVRALLEANDASTDPPQGGGQ